MSMQSNGPGWWLASDGRWYPPEGTALVPTVHVGAAGKWTSLSPDQAAAMAAQLLTSQGAIVTTQSPSALSGFVTTKKKADVVTAIILWFFCIVPAIVYLISASKDIQDPFTLTFVPDAGGTRMHGNGQGRGLSAAIWAADQVVAAGPTVHRPAF